MYLKCNLFYDFPNSTKSHIHTHPSKMKKQSKLTVSQFPERYYAKQSIICKFTVDRNQTTSLWFFFKFLPLLLVIEIVRFEIFVCFEHLKRFLPWCHDLQRVKNFANPPSNPNYMWYILINPQIKWQMKEPTVVTFQLFNKKKMNKKNLKLKKCLFYVESSTPERTVS